MYANSGITLTSYQESVIQNMVCPNVTQIQLQGSYFGSTNTLSTNSASFSYVVKSCPDMNLLREQFNISLVVCASDAEIKSATPSF